MPALKSAGQIIFVKKCRSPEVKKASAVWASRQFGSNTSTYYKSLATQSLQKYKVLHKILSWLDILRWDPDTEAVELDILFLVYPQQKINPLDTVSHNNSWLKNSSLLYN